MSGALTHGPNSKPLPAEAGERHWAERFRRLSTAVALQRRSKRALTIVMNSGGVKGRSHDCHTRMKISFGQEESIDNRLVHGVGKLRPQNSHARCHQHNANQLFFRVNPEIRAVCARPAVVPWAAEPAAG